MLDECDGTVKEKKKRIVESVRGPAFEIIQAVRYNDSDASPEEYLVALENAFGITKSGEDLYFAFRSMQQKSGERLSDFLRRKHCQRQYRKEVFPPEPGIVHEWSSYYEVQHQSLIF